MLYIPVIVSLLAIAFALFLFKKTQKVSEGSGKMVAVSNYIKEGTLIYFKKQSKAMGITVVILFVLFWVFLGFKTSFGFLSGVIFSIIAGTIGTLIFAKNNIKIAESFKTGLNLAINLSLRGGAIIGFLTMGLGLLLVSLFYLLVQDIKPLIALGFGASLISVFYRIGGMIYTKVTENVFNSIKRDILKNDSKNPEVITDLVGDNIAKGFGLTADIFGTYVIILISGIIFGTLFSISESDFSMLSLMMGSVAVLSSIISNLFIGFSKKQNTIIAFKKSIIVILFLSAFGFIFLSKNIIASLSTGFWNIYLPSLTGLAMAGGIFLIKKQYFFFKNKEIKKTNNPILELFIGTKSVIIPSIIMSLGIIFSFLTGGTEGLVITAVSIMSLAGIITALSFYQLLIDNALGIMKAEELENNTLKTINSINILKEEIKNTVKIYTIVSAILASLVLFLIYTQEVLGLKSKISFGLENYKVIIGIFLGGLIPYLLFLMMASAISRVVKKFKEKFNGNKEEGNHKFLIYISAISKAIFREIIILNVLFISSVIILGFILGVETVGGLLIGSIITGFFFSILVAEKNDNLAVCPMIKILNIIALLMVGFLV